MTEPAADQSAIETYWRQFLADTGRDPHTNFVAHYHFGSNAALATELLELVLQGTKCATTSALPCYEVDEDPVPSVGDLNILTTFDGLPRCVAQVTRVTIVPFGEMPWELARLEGEDENLASWRANHLKAIAIDAAEYGFNFDDETPVVFEEFKVIYR